MRERNSINFILMLCTLAMNSCVTIDNSSIRKISPLTKKEFKKLEGRFSNYPNARTKMIVRNLNGLTSIKSTLWSHFDQSLISTDSIESVKQQSVTLEFISKRKIIATIWDNDQIIKSKHIKGRIRGGYFYYGNHFYVLPFIPLVFGHNGHRSRIGITTENSIVINHKWNDWRFFILAGYSSKGQSNAEFVRIEDQ